MGQAIDKANITDGGISTGSSSIGNMLMEISMRMGLGGLSSAYVSFLAKAGVVFMCGSLASWVRVYCLGKKGYLVPMLVLCSMSS